MDLKAVTRRVLTIVATATVATYSLCAMADDKIVIGFSQSTLNHPWRIAQTEGNKKYAASHYPDVKLIVTDGQNNATRQTADVESLMAQGVKVLMISPLTQQALTPVVKQAMDHGIKVVTLDRRVNTPVTVHVGPEDLPIGRQAGELIAKKLNGQGAIIEIGGTAGASVSIDRDKGFREAIAKYPGLRIVAFQNCDFLREQSMKFMEDQIQRFKPGEIKAVYAHDDEMALGAIQALEAAGRLNGIIVVGINGANNAIQSVAEGKLTATFIYPFVAPEGIQTAYKVARGEPVPKDIKLQSTLITKDNAAQYIGKGF
ncbi:substrate-binding domain-containing protein [Paraburkholderia sabiae]|uniref:Substrate-binding domain-containing protein n=1 Tax=Paraburkholderia sabiae TaxID=273251 RepID=A0ABU9QI07_9BURK|nr:substrate-binding domain-containing protein [Paraburkholderia sabiae]WJZ77417.1 substrate-binding domain-containing protein [Paraburkholderia sabiae]CAD6557736.1 Ribose import binding protein RbsB [Paraburkholderia sabiae]